MNTTFHSILLLNSLLKDTCGILENCHDGDLCTIDTAQYENNEWICKFEEICEGGLLCDGSDGSCKLQMKLTPSDGKEYDYFGKELSISGNVLVVGGYSKATYVFEKNAHSNSWTQTAKLTADDGASDDRFGYSVDIFGDTIIVGAAWHNNTGAAYIYSRQDGGNWTQAAKITASDGAEGNKFGYTVAASEDLVVVGNFKSSGAVYIFEKDVGSGDWKETRKLLTHKNPRSLSISGNDLAVGSMNSQSVIVYKRNETDGSWAQTMTLTSPIGSTSDLFGNSVSVDGDVMIVGEHFSKVKKGVVYVYEKNQTTWELTANLTADDGSNGDYFGSIVAVSNGTIVVGALGYASYYTGSAYTFQKHAGNWKQMNKITTDNGQIDSDLGWNLDIDEDIVAFGAYGDDGRIGSVYLNKLLT
jgi:hypothetical protein